MSKSVQSSPRNMRGLEKVRICCLRHLNRYISGTRSVCQMTSKLDQWPKVTFQMSLSVSKSVLLSPRNRCEFEKVRIWRLRHLNRSIFGTGSARQMTSELDQWPDITFRMSPSVSKSVQPSPRNRCEKIDRPKGAHTHTHTFSDLVELSRMVYNTRGLRGSVQKSVFEAILYPFYQERQKE